MMVLQNTTKGTYNEHIKINNSQKTADIEIEDFRLYRAELVQNIPKIIFLKNYRP